MGFDVSDTSFKEEILDSKTVTLVDFWAPWCGPCRMVAPILEEIGAELSDKLKICKINIDENTEKAAEYHVRSIPTLMIFKDGKAVGTKVGAPTKEILMDFINLHI